MMKRSYVLLLAVAAVLLIAACQNTDNENANDHETRLGNYTTAPATTQAAPDIVEEERNPAATVSAFFGYLADGNVRAADGLMIYSRGGFADMAEDMYQDLGMFIFHGITYHDLVYTINGNRATVSFTMVNNDFNVAAQEAGFAIGYAIGQSGVANPDDVDLEAIMAEQLFPMIAEMVMDGTAPVFEMDFTLNLRMVGDTWRIVDNDVAFAMALVGVYN